MANDKVLLSLDAVGEVAASASADVSGRNLDGATVYATGTLTNTCVLQVSHDGTNWYTAKALDGVTAMADVTGNTAQVVSGQANYVRANMTAWTSGSRQLHILFAAR